MFVRRAFYYWQPAAVVVLPLWILIGWSIFGGSAWQFLLVLLSCGVLALALAGVGLLNFTRKKVRTERALSWPDVALAAGWHAAIVATGFLTAATPLLSVAVVVLGLAAFWVSIVELARETRRRVQGVYESFQYAAQMGAPAGAAAGVGAAPRPPIVDEHEYIVIETSRGQQN
ncbi:MFS transporter [Subtercola endophyticus]|uniref:MFS transporter n=1 Tax=Subtercola endophyticus TaxID=2895559 RepID=UPI001E55B532|nr:MFS transporter [Subtercola endophyticus]UFS60991.1 MFS transporter [Subtercola endophyticus]